MKQRKKLHIKQPKHIRKRKRPKINRTPKTYSFIGLRLFGMQLTGLWRCKQNGGEYYAKIAKTVEGESYLSDEAFERFFGGEQ